MVVFKSLNSKTTKRELPVKMCSTVKTLMVMMTKRGVEGPWVSVDQPPLPTSMPGAGQSPGKCSLGGSKRALRQGQGVVQVEDHPVLRHVTPAPPHMRLSGLRGQGVVALEDHPTLRHVTGSPPHQLLCPRTRALGGV